MDTQEQAPAATPPPPPPRRLMRSEQDRVIGGVCGGLGRYFGIDPIIFRIAALALVFAGGAGALMYLAGLLLIPSGDDPAQVTPPGAAAGQPPQPDRNRWLMVGLVVAAVLVAGPLLAIPALIIGVPLLVLGAVLLPFATLALVGIAIWWLVAGRRPAGAGDLARAALLGVGVLLLLALLSLGAAWAAAAGGGGVVAGFVIAAGVMLVAAAFVGGARWLILPALAIAFPLALVSATGLDLDGGVGERVYRPGSTAEIRDSYELGAGSLRIDLRDVAFTDADVPLHVDVGIGEAVLVVPPQVCVATRAQVGMGEVRVFDRDNGGLDVDVQDIRTAAEGHPRLLLDAEVGIGSLQVRHDDLDPFFDGFEDGRFGSRMRGAEPGEDGNTACRGAAS